MRKSFPKITTSKLLSITNLTSRQAQELRPSPEAVNPIRRNATLPNIWTVPLKIHENPIPDSNDPAALPSTPATCNLDHGYQPDRSQENENLAERRRGEREKCVLGAPTIVLPARHWVLAFDYARRASARETSERANGWLHRAIPWYGVVWNGMEWNGTEWQECYKISAFTVSALYASTCIPRGRPCVVYSLLGVLLCLLRPRRNVLRCHRGVASRRRHRRPRRYSSSFLCVRSTYRHLIISHDRGPWSSSMVLSSTILFVLLRRWPVDI